MPHGRTTEDVLREIEHERDELVRAVARLRGDLHAAANVRPLLRRVAVGAAGLAALRLVARRLSGARRRRR
ncbi:MAG TPA: hypothetical protein VFB42_14590 [Gaiellaceae bacterium]|nr:hypothetical protein [Gaiellaceae bacterium]